VIDGPDVRFTLGYLAMSSQRARERRIIEKLRAGILRPATPLDTPRSKAGGESRCDGCDEVGADSLVGDNPWHYLCVLFWQGRSESVAAGRSADASSDRKVTPERSRWTIVVRVDRPAVYTSLRRSFAGSSWVSVVVDRRYGERRRSGGAAPGSERRGGGRRSADRLPTHVPEFRLAHRGDGFDVYEATGPESGRCPQCGVLVSVEMPRFTEPPARLELTVLHETIPPDRARHVVEVQSFTATGRVLLASRLFVRTRSEST
jgi:hypothetical protein